MRKKNQQQKLVSTSSKSLKLDKVQQLNQKKKKYSQSCKMGFRTRRQLDEKTLLVFETVSRMSRIFEVEPGGCQLDSEVFEE
jgi:hypothetical protein